MYLSTFPTYKNCLCHPICADGQQIISNNCSQCMHAAVWGVHDLTPINAVLELHGVLIIGNYTGQQYLK